MQAITSLTSPVNDEHSRSMPLMYARPSLGYKATVNAMASRPAVDVIATYMNSSDTRLNMKADVLALGHSQDQLGPADSLNLSLHSNNSNITSVVENMNNITIMPSQNNKAQQRMNPASSSSIINHAHNVSRDSSAEWGWFHDIESSGDSLGENSITSILRRQLSTGNDSGHNHIIHDEQQSTSRMTAAMKTFPGEQEEKVVTGAISIPKFRIVQSRTGADRHAEYLVIFKFGREYHADWRRYSEFAELVKKLEASVYPRALVAWRAIDNRWFNRLEPSYLHKKCIDLELFLRDLMYECQIPDLLTEFLGNKVNARPSDPTTVRASAQLPKEERPKQPQEERELFEKLWAENFKRSAVHYGETTTNANTVDT